MIDRLSLAELAGDYYWAIAGVTLKSGSEAGLSELLYAISFYRFSRNPEEIQNCRKILPEGITLEDLEGGGIIRDIDSERYVKQFINQLYRRYFKWLKEGEEIKAIRELHREVLRLGGEIV